VGGGGVVRTAVWLMVGVLAGFALFGVLTVIG